MSATEQQLVAGYAITANRERVSSISSRFYCGNEPASVALHRMGSDERSWMTPDEARRLAEALRAAADVAESKP